MKYLYILVILLISSSAFAYDEERALTNLGHEYVTCAGYFTIVANALSNTPKSKSLQATYVGNAELALGMGVAFSNTKTALARYVVGYKLQMDEIENNYSNISRLYAQHASVCKNGLGDPGARMQYWLEKEDE